MLNNEHRGLSTVLRRYRRGIGSIRPPNSIRICNQELSLGVLAVQRLALTGEECESVMKRMAVRALRVGV